MTSCKALTLASRRTWFATRLSSTFHPLAPSLLHKTLFVPELESSLSVLEHPVPSAHSSGSRPALLVFPSPLLRTTNRILFSRQINANSSHITTAAPLVTTLHPPRLLVPSWKASHHISLTPAPPATAVHPRGDQLLPLHPLTAPHQPTMPSIFSTHRLESWTSSA